MNKQYWGFLSYSHKDEKLVERLHKALEVIHLPRKEGVPKQLFPIFRDQDELPTSANLGKDLHNALNDSLFLIVVCTPNSALSKWVNEEVKFYIENQRLDDIIVIIDMDSVHMVEDCLPEKLIHPYRENKLTNLIKLTSGRKFKKSVQLLASTMLNIDNNVIVKHHRRRLLKRFFLILLTPIIIILFLILFPTLMFFVDQDSYFEMAKQHMPSQASEEQAKEIAENVFPKISGNYIEQAIRQSDLVLVKVEKNGEAYVTLGEVSVALSFLNGINLEYLKNEKPELADEINNRRERLEQIYKKLNGVYSGDGERPFRFQREH